MELAARSTLPDRQHFATFSFAIAVAFTLLTGYSLFVLFYVIGLVGGGLAILAYESHATVPDLQSHETVSNEGFPGHCTNPGDRARLDSELELFKSLIVRDCIASWYGRFAEPADYLEVEVLIGECIGALVSSLLQLDAVRLLCVVTERFHAHYGKCIDATRIAQGGPERCGRDEGVRNLHRALAAPPETEVRHNKGIAGALLCKILPKQHQRNMVLVELLTEVIGLHVITPIIDMFAKSGVAHEILWKCLSDSDLGEHDHDLFPADEFQNTTESSSARVISGVDVKTNIATLGEMIPRTSNEGTVQEDAHGSQGCPIIVYGDREIKTSDTMDELDEPASPEEYVSDELTKYFKVAPEVVPSPDVANSKRPPSDADNLAATARNVDHSLLTATAMSPHELFTNVQVTNVQMADDNCGVLYTIMYKAWYQRSDGSASALKSRTIKKHHQDLVILHHMLLGNAEMAEHMRAVRTPSCLDDGYQLTSEPNEVHELRQAVNEYLQLLTGNRVLCHSKYVRQFLEYDGGNFAMRNKPADVGIPRLNQVLARTWSGVWDKMSRFGFESKPRIERQAEETDKLFDEFKFGVALDEPKGTEDEDFKLLSALKLLAEEDEKAHGTPKDAWSPPADDCRLVHTGSHSSLDVRGPVTASATHRGSHPHAAASAVLELGFQCLQHCNGSCWVLSEHVVAFVKNTLASWLQKHLQELLRCHLSMLRLAHYVHLLHDTLTARSENTAAARRVPSAPAVSIDQHDHERSASESEGFKHYQKALSALRSALPGFLPLVLGAATFDRCLASFLASFDDELLNKHLIYTVMDDVVAELLAVSDGAAVTNVVNER